MKELILIWTTIVAKSKNNFSRQYTTGIQGENHLPQENGETKICSVICIHWGKFRVNIFIALYLDGLFDPGEHLIHVLNLVEVLVAEGDHHEAVLASQHAGHPARRDGDAGREHQPGRRHHRPQQPHLTGYA
jgi:hypothetical protein